MLFAGEEANGSGKWGDGLSDWFSRHLAKRGVAGRRLGMHSFRHTFEDRLREAGLHGTALGAELAGRSKGDTASAYGSGFSTRALAEAVAKINYPGLHLP
jgi:integrase